MFALDEQIDPEIAVALIDAAGGPFLAPSLLAEAQRIAAVEEMFAYRIAASGSPEPLLSSSDLAGAAERSGAYARRFHYHDPAARARLSARPGSGFVERVRAVDIGRSDYRALCFDRPRFTDKVCFGWRGADQSYVISFYRSSDEVDKLPKLTALAGVGLIALARHERLRHKERFSLVERLETRMKSAYPNLSHREIQICARTLAGWSAGRIAAALGIRPSSVLTYRQRAYQRASFSSASEFLDGML